MLVERDDSEQFFLLPRVQIFVTRSGQLRSNFENVILNS